MDESQSESKEGYKMENKPSEIVAKAEEIKDNIVDKYRDFDERYTSPRDKMYAVNDNALRFIEDNPVVAIGVAVSVGYLIGRLASRRWIV